ncbi:hypothetical protein ABN028_16380 [Actinopolymorpha sp. B17G11]|uniref:hypothetical protein n=1 Tax=Actinopolymorpha sp. B17G11 TaxID=3160861 RepID=UPI0032E39A2E
MSETWTFKHDGVLPFGGEYGGFVHVRAYVAGDEVGPIVLVGELSDPEGIPTAARAVS